MEEARSDTEENNHIQRCRTDSEPVDGRIDWQQACSGVPTEDWLEGLDAADRDDLAEVVDNFVFYINGEDYLCWEAVIREEQELPLTQAHEEKLDALLNFGDDEDEDILYINDFARPDKPLYETLRHLAPPLAGGEVRDRP